MIPYRLLTFIPLALMLTSVASHDHQHLLQFHENKGQWPEQVLYRAFTPAGAVFIEKGGFTYLLQQGGAMAGHGIADHKEEPLRMHAVKVHFDGGHAAHTSGGHQLPYHVNYFLGNDPAKWAGGCGVYGQVELRSVYPGIDLKVDGHTGMKYDWLVAAGADPSRINMRYEGQDRIHVEGGLLFIRTTAGDMIEQRPVAWQEVDGAHIPVKCAYLLEGSSVTFELPDGHDPRYPLVIDPVVVFSSLTGSTGDNFGSTATYDEEGHLYGSGIIREAGYPVTAGVVQSTFQGLSMTTCDIGISKFTPDGTSLVWSTYLGGTGSEMPHSLVVNSNDELYLLATTGSSDFPVTSGAMQTSFNGGTLPPFSGSSYGFTFNSGTDIVVTHFNADATALVGSTYVGGSGNDGLNQELPLNRNYGDPFRGEIIMDLEERPLIVSTTLSTNMQTTSDAFQSTLAGGMDAYLFRMDPELTTLLWATYYGGTGHEAGYGVQIASNGDIFISGGTTSADLPMAGTPADDSFNGVADGYIAKFPAAGGALLASTYVGTTAYDQTYFVQLDLSDEVYVVGSTLGVYPVTPGKYSTASGMQFIHKFNNDLSASLWSTRVGSTGNENLSLTAFLVSNCGQIYFSAWGSSTNGSGMAGVLGNTFGLPVTPDAFQPSTNGGDFWLVMLQPDAESLGYATFFGGSTSQDHVDGGTSRFNKDGIIYHAVCASCGFGPVSYPTTPGAWSETDNGVNCNLGVFKIDFEQAVQVDIQLQIAGEVVVGNATVCVGEEILFQAVGTANSWTWHLGTGAPPIQDASVQFTYDNAGVYEVMLVGIDENACDFADSTFLSVTVLEPQVLVPALDYEVDATCQGFEVTFINNSTGGGTFEWEFSDGGGSTEDEPVHFFQLADTYTITLYQTDPVCDSSADTTFTIVLDPPPLELNLPEAVAMCNGEEVVLDAGPGHTVYLWSTGAITPAIIVTDPAVYTVVVHNGVCMGADTVTVVEQPVHPPADDVMMCPGMESMISPPVPTSSILWSTGEETHSITPLETGEYTFFAYDQYGCPFQDTIHVTIATGEGVAMIPNVFSPNGDGHNDLFQVAGLALEEFSLRIFDRWGTMVFDASDPQRGWNGGISNGSVKAPEGTYFYEVSFRDRCTDIPLTQQQGHITLLR